MGKVSLIGVASLVFIFGIKANAGVADLDKTLPSKERKVYPVDKMHNTLGNAYYALSKEHNNKKAISYFEDALGVARRLGNWQGCLDAGIGLIALGKGKEGLKACEEALRFSKTGEDWRGCIAVGYGLGSLPKKMKKKSAKEAFLLAKVIAVKLKDWRGGLKAGEGFLSLAAAIKDSIGCFDSAFSICKEQKSLEGVETLKEAFKKAGAISKSRECEEKAKEFKAMYAEHKPRRTSPPPGWSPVGETVREPKRISLEAQRLNRASIDKDIQAKNEWIKQQETIEAERKRYERAYDYYYCPYDSHIWDVTDSPTYLYNWALNRLRYYRLRDGVYYYHYPRGTVSPYTFSID